MKTIIIALSGLLMTLPSSVWALMGVEPSDDPVILFPPTALPAHKAEVISFLKTKTSYLGGGEISGKAGPESVDYVDGRYTGTTENIVDLMKILSEKDRLKVWVQFMDLEKPTVTFETYQINNNVGQMPAVRGPETPKGNAILLKVNTKAKQINMNELLKAIEQLPGANLKE